jgi:hypothetical protein
VAEGSGTIESSVKEDKIPLGRRLFITSISGIDPSRRLMRCSDLSFVDAKAEVVGCAEIDVHDP